MLKRLRYRLTFLYLMVGTLLVGIVGVSTYTLLSFFFQNSNDAALAFKMAVIFYMADETPPPSLTQAKEKWLAQKNISLYRLSQQNETEDNEGDTELEDEYLLQEAYEGELASIFILPVDYDGNLMFNPNPYPILMEPDQSAVENALLHGFDKRNGKLADGTPVRLLTYRFPKGSGYDLIQLGKPTGDQFRVLQQFVSGLLAVGISSIILLGVGSWWMAGNTMQPTQLAWDRQQQFIANASHELRTPLTLIRASAELALRRSPPESNSASLMMDVIHESDQMTRLVEDMLLLSRLDAHQLTLTLVEMDVPMLLKDVQRQFIPLLKDKNLSFEIESSACKILADEARIRQVLFILLDNAIRHTPQNGKISITACCSEKQVILEVKDTGEGIPAEALPHIFDRFFQVQDARGNHGNSGLGLSIAKSLVEAMHGSIHIESQLGQGTQVRLCLSSIETV